MDRLASSVRCYRLTILACVVVLSLLWSPAWVRAFDWFGSGKSQETTPGTVSQPHPFPSFASIAKTATPAVVNISTTQKVKARSRRSPVPSPRQGPFGEEDPFEEFFRRFYGDQPPPGEQRSLGSGFIISNDGYILTNNHVIDDAGTVTVRLSNKEEYKAKVIGVDDKTDLALIKINATHSLPFVPLGVSANLQVGDWVLAIGNPFGLEETVTAGIVSAKGRIIEGGAYDDFIQTDASINPGNSGGPLLNLQGEVIGINSAIFSQSGGNIGIGFAVPSDLAKSILTQLKEKGKVTRAWLGVAIQDVTPELAKSFGLSEPHGALVADVTPRSPADKAGIERGDIIVTFNGTGIADSHALPALVAQQPVGDHVNVTVLRRGVEKTVTVKLGQLTAQQANAERGEDTDETWGFAVATLTPQIRRRFQLESDQQGVVVTDVAADSPADRGDLQPGDVIEEVNRQTVDTVEDFAAAVTTAAKDQATLLLLVQRGDQQSFVVLRQEE